ncbi:MAG: ABC transporter permease [Candidatus Ventricola sp.]
MHSKRHTLSRRIARHWQLYLFLLLPLIYLLIFHYYPMTGVQIAFKKYSARLGIWGSPWVGLKNILKFFNSVRFTTIVGNTLRLSLYSLIAGFPLPVIFALMLGVMRNERYKKVVQTITYMPHFISVVVLVSMILQIFNPILGIYGKAYSALFGTAAPDLLGSPAALPHIYVWSGIWQSFGWDSIIYVAALAAVSPELHEAAQIDGASRFQRVLHVDLPAILPTATIMLILRTGKVMSIGFEKIFLLQNDLNLTTSEVISTYVYKVSLKASVPDFSYSTAIDLFNSVINLFLICTVNFISGRISETSLW